MSMTTAVILFASLPLIVAFVCRCNALTDGPGRILTHPVSVLVNLALLIGSGWVVYVCTQDPPGLPHWAVVLTGWLWLVATLPSTRRAIRG